MSVRHIGLVLDHLSAAPPVKLVALILADHADSDGICWPSYRRIAERACLTERSVARHVARLVELGLVRKVETGHGPVRGAGVGEWTTNRYCIDAAALAALPELRRRAAGSAAAPAGVVDTAVYDPPGGGRHSCLPGGGQGCPGVVDTAVHQTVIEEQPSIGTTTLFADACESGGAVAQGSVEVDFEEWWAKSRRVGTKADAFLLYRHWREQGAGSSELLIAVTRYVEHCAATGRRQMDGRTFLARTDQHRNPVNRWREWAAGEEHGSMDAAGEARLRDVLEVGLEWMGGARGGLDGASVVSIGSGGGAADPAGRQDARRGLPARSVADAE